MRYCTSYGRCYFRESRTCRSMANCPFASSDSEHSADSPGRGVRSKPLLGGGAQRSPPGDGSTAGQAHAERRSGAEPLSAAPQTRRGAP